MNRGIACSPLTCAELQEKRRDFQPLLTAETAITDLPPLSFSALIGY
jgi:hypothetical protein